MRQELGYLLAERRGSKVAEDFGFTSLPVEPREIAVQRDIKVEGKDLHGCCGCFIHHGGCFGIVYSTNLANEGMVNFTIAHELGHYFLDGHATELFPAGQGVHQSLRPFQSLDPREREADRFAVGMLLPEKLFRQVMNTVDPGITGIKDLQSQCGASLTATAIRVATLADGPLAVVVSRESRVEYCFMSESLRDIRGIEWLKKGMPIYPGSMTFELCTDPDRVNRAEIVEGWSSFDLWFDGAPEWECQEDAIGLGRFSQTLTVLWSEKSFADDNDDCEK